MGEKGIGPTSQSLQITGPIHILFPILPNGVLTWPFFRVTAILVGVLKLMIAGLLVLGVLADANHAFGVAYRPPEWHPVHFVLILGAVGIAYPYSLMPSFLPLSLAFLALASIPTFIGINQGINDMAKHPASDDWLNWVSCVLPFLLAVIEIAFRHIADKGKKTMAAA